MFSLVVIAEKKKTFYLLGERYTVIWDYMTDDFYQKRKKKKNKPKKVELVSLLC